MQLGPRPFYLVQGMDEGKLKDRLLRCENGPFYRTDFSIGHRGAPMQFPEHTKESYEAGARMGAGIVECDVTFTKDGELVCRHSECDLHTTTNIVATPCRCGSPPWALTSPESENRRSPRILCQRAFRSAHASTPIGKGAKLVIAASVVAHSQLSLDGGSITTTERFSPLTG